MPNLSINDRPIRLAGVDQMAMVVPSDGTPPFPMSQLTWLDEVADSSYQVHGRCMCIALVLDAVRRVWARPVVPTQQCGPDGTRWTWSADDFAGRSPAARVCGSFQSAQVRSLSEAVALVPPTDGIHIVSAKGQPQDLAYMFLHAQGQTMIVQIQDLVVDDIAAALKTNAKRLAMD